MDVNISPILQETIESSLLQSVYSLYLFCPPVQNSFLISKSKIRFTFAKLADEKVAELVTACDYTIISVQEIRGRQESWKEVFSYVVEGLLDWIEAVDSERVEDFRSYDLFSLHGDAVDVGS